MPAGGGSAIQLVLESWSSLVARHPKWQDIKTRYLSENLICNCNGKLHIYRRGKWYKCRRSDIPGANQGGEGIAAKKAAEAQMVASITEDVRTTAMAEAAQTWMQVRVPQVTLKEVQENPADRDKLLGDPLFIRTKHAIGDERMARTIVPLLLENPDDVCVRMQGTCCAASSISHSPN